MGLLFLALAPSLACMMLSAVWRAAFAGLPLQLWPGLLQLWLLTRLLLLLLRSI
jgi:hypothetical protein